MAGRKEATPAGTIHRTIALLHDALRALHVQMPLPEEERIAVMINQAMTAGARSFHTPEHVFDLVHPGRPHGTLAALFHDLVYYQVDQGFVPQVASVLQPRISASDGGLRIRAETQGDRLLELTMAVFGFVPGQVLPPFGGMNEFLSALVMNRALGHAVSEDDLLIATACIEATIPFRKPAADGTTPAQALEARLGSAVASLGLDLSAGQVTEAVQLAVVFANGDVANFGDREVTRFLDNTWKLLPETNPSLRFQGVYSVKSYRVALQKMEGFLQSLDPNTIFARHAGVPGEKDYHQKLRRAERNVITARAYLGIKLLTAAILEALADISGGDAPISLFMGDIGAKEKGSRLEDHLPAYHAPNPVVLDVTLHDLLAHGRASASSFDLQNSPLSLFIYLHLGTEGFRDFLGAARRMFDGALDARSFLDTLPRSLVIGIAEGCAKMAFTRRPALLAFAAAGAHAGRTAGRGPRRGASPRLRAPLRRKARR